MLGTRHLLRKQQNIVVLDDDSGALNFFKVLLEPFSKCNIFFYDYPTDDFCKTIHENSIDLFIMDIKLGNCNGIILSEDIVSKHRGSIFLFVSGYDYDERDFQGLNGKCVYDFIHKPVNREIFSTVTSTLLNVASTYKVTHIDKYKEKNLQTDIMRKKYLKQIKADRLSIQKLRHSMLYGN